MKKSNPFVEKQEEKSGKDLDHDGEKGESAAHKKKIKQAAAATALVKKPSSGGKKPLPPFIASAKGSKKPFPVKKKMMKTGKAMCPACTKGKMSSCSH